MTAATLHAGDAPIAPPSRYRPDWLKKPSGDDLAWAYPERAAREGIGGKATIHCWVAPDGGAMAPAEITIPIVFSAPEPNAVAPAPPGPPPPAIVLLSKGHEWVVDHLKTPSGPQMAIGGLAILVLLAVVVVRRWSLRSGGRDLSGPNSERR
jgi:hypothetical protein